MVIMEDKCVGCPPRMCIGRACGRRDVEVLVCDWCGSSRDVEERYTAAVRKWEEDKPKKEEYGEFYD